MFHWILHWRHWVQFFSFLGGSWSLIQFQCLWSRLDFVLTHAHVILQFHLLFVGHHMCCAILFYVHRTCWLWNLLSLWLSCVLLILSINLVKSFINFVTLLYVKPFSFRTFSSTILHLVYFNPIVGYRIFHYCVAYIPRPHVRNCTCKLYQTLYILCLLPSIQN